MNLQTVVAVVAIIAAYLYFRHKQKQADTDDQSAELFDSARLQREIMELARCAKELEQLDNMLIDLRLCRPDELHRNFRVQWCSSTGDHALDFMSDGQNANTANLIAIATDQREAVNEQIQQRIIDLYEKAQSLDFYSEYNAERHAQSSAQCAAGE